MLNQKPLATPRPRFWPGQRRLPMVAVLAPLRSVSTKPIARIDRPVDAARPFLGGVLQAELDRVDAQLLGQLVDHLLAGEGGLRRAGRAIGLRLRLVDAGRRSHRPGRWECRSS